MVQLALVKNTRLLFLAAFLLGALPAFRGSSGDSAPDSSEPPFNAEGERVGEVRADSVLIHTRLTLSPTRRVKGYVPVDSRHGLFSNTVLPLPAGIGADDLEGAVPGKAGEARLVYGMDATLLRARSTPWLRAKPEADYTCLFHLSGLKPDTLYYYAVEMRSSPSSRRRRGELGQFRTAPRPDGFHPVKFTVITGQHYVCKDSPEGYLSYQSMLALMPDFHVSTGDSVYYDNEPPLAKTVELARHHWHRMYSLPSLVRFFRSVPGYWIKDDHDTLHDDCWPTMAPEVMKPLTFADGVRIFLEQAPIEEPTFRTYQWGSGLQIWLVEGRDFRSSNEDPDGPEKTIWGKEQKEWLKKSVLASRADFRILISPTPIVGPDRSGKGDNHANAAFATEGREFREWVKANNLRNFFVVCGDRHWQYHSVDPSTGLREFSCGPLSDQHAGGSPGENKEFHRFHRVKGGFLEVALEGAQGQAQLSFRFHDVNGKTVYEAGFAGREVGGAKGLDNAPAGPITIVANPGRFGSIEKAASSEQQVDFWDEDQHDDDACGESFAATELRHYLARCLGREESTIQLAGSARLPAEGDVFVLGNRRSNPLVGLWDSATEEKPKLENPESYRFRAARRDGRLITVIEGSSRVGTLYGVYDYLERLGMRFYGLGEEGLVYPPAPVMLPDSLDVTQSPAFENRGFFAWEPRGNPDFFLWMARNRLNYWNAAEPQVHLLKKLGLRLSIGQHELQPVYLNPAQEYPYNLASLQSDDSKPVDPYAPGAQAAVDANGDGKLSYFEVHPEWFGLRDGKRSSNVRGGRGDNFCTANPDAVAELSRNLIKGLIDGPWRYGDIVNFWMSDSGQWCECERCAALGTPTDRLLVLLYQVNRGIQQARRDGRLQRPIHLSTLAYWETIQAPTRPLPQDFDYQNCSVTFYPMSRCYVHSLADPACTETNKRFADAFADWTTGQGRHYRGAIVIGEYYNVSYCRSLPVLYTRAMTTDIPWYYRQGARQFQYMHTLTSRWGTWTLNQRLMARLLWDPGQDATAILGDYFKKYYPATAASTREFYRHLEDAFVNVTFLMKRMPGYVKGNSPLKDHLHYEIYHPPVNDAPDLLEIVDSLQAARRFLDDSLLACRDAVELGRLLEDEARFSYGESMVFFYYHFYRLRVAEKQGQERKARLEFTSLRDFAERLNHVTRDFIETYTDPGNGLDATGLRDVYEAVKAKYAP